MLRYNSLCFPFRDMLNKLSNCFENRHCANYWIPTLNVMSDIDGSDCDRKRQLLRQIIANPKYYIADQWLEHVRCIRLNCYFCGPAVKKDENCISRINV